MNTSTQPITAIEKYTVTTRNELSTFNPIRVSENTVNDETAKLETESSFLIEETDSTQEKIIKSLSGVVTKITENDVEIKLGEDTFILFPVELFIDKTIIKYGQPLNYQILADAAGFRYQRLSKFEDDKSTPEKEKILNILNNIPLD